MKDLFLFFALFLFSACSPRLSDGYHARYAHLSSIRLVNQSPCQFKGTHSYYLVVLVDARHLDYSTPENYFATLSRGVFKRQDPNVGHAWIVLAGTTEAGLYEFEGGHTGEYGVLAPKYFDHILELSEEGSCKDPVSYLYSALPDGRREWGAGGHRPTFAAAFPLNKQGFLHIQRLVEGDYDFSSWGILGPNCVYFAQACLSSIGIDIACEEKIPIPQFFSIHGKKIRLWENPKFSCILSKTPELLEKRLIELVQSRQALPAAHWYSHRKQKR